MNRREFLEATTALLVLAACSNDSKPSGEVANASELEIADMDVVVGDSDGTLFQASRAQHTVSRMEAGGTAWTVGTRGTGPGQFDFPVALAADSRGRLLVVDRGNDRVQILDRADGRYLGEFGASGRGAGQFRLPRYIAVSADRIYVSDQLNHRVNVFDLDGKSVSSIGTPGRGVGQMNMPRGLAVDGESRLYVADGANVSVSVYGADGAFLSLLANGDRLDSPHGLALDSAGKLWVADGSAGRVFVMTPQGELVSTVDTRFADGRLAAPHDIAASRGRVFVRALPNGPAV